MNRRHLFRYRLTIDQVAAVDDRYPRVTAIDGETFAVDEVGLITIGRRWPIDTPPTPVFVERADKWLAEAEAGRIKTPTLNSYSLKHAAECFARDYVSNGAFIVAASKRGFRMIPEGPPTHPAVNMIVGIGWGWYRRRKESLQGYC